MMAYLVYHGYVNEITISFLMVGHTHEDIDAGFSHISRKLKTHSAKSLPKLLDILKTCTYAGMMPVLLPASFNIKEWLIPYLNDIHNQSFPHVYRLYKDKHNHVALKYKHWSTDLEWWPKLDEDPLEIFKICPNGLQKLPPGIPDIVVPEISRKHDLHEIKCNILNLETLMRPSDLEWWEDFLNDPHGILQCSSIESTTGWYLNDTNRVHQEIAIPMSNICNTEATPLDLYMDKEKDRRQVYTGKRKSTRNDDSSKTPKINVKNGYMILFKDDDGDLGIGEVKDHIGSSHLNVALYNGPVNGKWSLLDKVPTQLVHKDWIMSGMIFQLTSSNYLPNRVKKYFKDMEKEFS